MLTTELKAFVYDLHAILLTHILIM